MKSGQFMYWIESLFNIMRLQGARMQGTASRVFFFKLLHAGYYAVLCGGDAPGEWVRSGENYSNSNFIPIGYSGNLIPIRTLYIYM